MSTGNNTTLLAADDYVCCPDAASVAAAAGMCPAAAPPVYAWIVLVVLTSLSGIFSGLNLGLMSLTVEDLNIIIRSSSVPKQIAHAHKILPLRRRGNLLLCTLLIGNTVVNVMLSVLTDPIWTFMFGSNTLGTVLSLALPSALIVVIGEIIPQSVCSRYALSIGARMVPLTYCFVVLTAPFSVPISLLLDKLLGDEISGVFTRQGLLELVKLNVESSEHAKASGLTKADGRLLGGALTFKEKAVAEVMTPLEDVYALPITAVLDQPTFLAILSKGHTRIPVYDGPRSNVVALLLAKNLLGIGYERALPLKQVLELFQQQGALFANRIVRVHQHTKLNVALDLCKSKRVHMLVVTSERASTLEDGSLREVSVSLRDQDGSSTSLCSPERHAPSAWAGAGECVGIATIEDFLEEILQEEIVDETDVYESNTPRSYTSNTGSATPGLRKLNSRHFDCTVVLRKLDKAEQPKEEELQGKV